MMFVTLVLVYSLALSTDAQTTKNILLFSREGLSQWKIRDGHVDHLALSELNCPATNCHITTNITYLPSIKDFDAIVMKFNTNTTEAEQYLFRDRRPGQLFIHNFREAPARTKKHFGSEALFYNWTMSYRMDADIGLPYGYFLDKETGMVVAPAWKPSWKKPSFDGKILQNSTVISLVQNKTKFAAWFVSNCDPPSKRKFLVQKMQQFVDVDVYGKCGTLNCTKDIPGFCHDMVEKDYKFYLSFENSLCEDYVTEKAFAIMKYSTIPVVYGGADYNRVLPPRSYINVADYDSVEDLVNYLIFLANNTEEYMKYFWWRDHYDIRGSSNFCNLCEKVSSVGDKPKFTQFYNDLDNYWFNRNGSSSCMEPEYLPIMDKVLRELKGTTS